MLTKKVFLFNKLIKLFFFYRVKKIVHQVAAITVHNNFLLFDLDKLLYFMFQLFPFFFNLIQRQGGVFFIGIKFILLKWFQNQRFNNLQEISFLRKGGAFSNFFRVRIWATFKDSQLLTNLPITLFFLNFDNYINATQEIHNLPSVGIFEKNVSPLLVYSLGILQQSFFINCFFFKLFSRALKHVY